MSDDALIRERLAALEVQVKHLTAIVEKQANQIDILVETFQQAKGARWLLIALVGIGSFTAAKFPTVVSWFSVAKG